MNKNQYLHSINWFRGLAITFVVLIHIDRKSLFYFFDSDIIGHIVGNGTFFFIFISGYLFWHLIEKYQFRNYIQTKIKNVIFPYIFILTLTIVLISVVTIYNPQSWIINYQNSFSENGFFWHILIGRTIITPLWFIPMIAIFFITSKLVNQISNSKWFYLIFIISFIHSITSVRTTEINYTYPLLMYTHFFGIYLFGIACKKNEDRIINNSKLIALISFPLYVLAIWYNINLKTNMVSTDSFLNFDQLKQFFGVLFFFSIFVLIEKANCNLKILDILAKYSFGIFFIHWHFIYILRHIFRQIPYMQYWGLEFISIFSLSIICSILSCKSIKYLTGSNSRYFIGC